MQNNNKKEKIIDAMQRLMNKKSAQSISVSDIAKEAGIGKGSIYYYFETKEEIINSVIERSHAQIIESSKRLISDPDLDALTKLQLIFKACRESSLELSRQESMNFFEKQQSALLHRRYVEIMTENLCPVVADIIRQGNTEGCMRCATPAETAKIVLILLTVLLDNQSAQTHPEQTNKTLTALADIFEKSFDIQKGYLDYLRI